MFMEFQGIENARQLGGLTREDGARIRQGVLLRTGMLEKATDEDIRRLEELGLAHIIDFRDIREVEEHPDRPISARPFPAAGRRRAACAPAAGRFAPVAGRFAAGLTAPEGFGPVPDGASTSGMSTGPA